MSSLLSATLHKLVAKSGRRTEKPPKKSRNIRDSPFRDSLYSNYAPTDLELQEIRGLCAHSLGEITKAKAEIRRLQKLLAKAEKKRDELEALYNAHDALLSPIRRISVELMQLIFWFCIPEDRSPAMSAYDAPLLLTRVCRDWRDIAFDTPELWASIHAVVPSVDDKAHALLRLQVFKDWISRSGQRPLDISLYIHQPERKKVVLAFLQEMLACSRRWAHITLVIPVVYMSQLDALSDSEHEPLRQLRSFELTTAFSRPGHNTPTPHQYVRSGAALPKPLKFLGRAPNIRSLLVALNTDPISDFLPLFPTGSTLEQLVVDYPYMFNRTPAELLAFLSRCQNLRKLEIWGYNPDGQLLVDTECSSNEHNVTLPNLECLTSSVVRTHGTGATLRSGILHLLSHLITPNLKQLHLYCADGRFNDPIATTLTDLFSRSSPCPLETLELRTEVRFSPDGMFISPLQHVPSLKRLTVNMGRHRMSTNTLNGEPEEQERDLLTGLTLNPDEQPHCCPNLEEVMLKQCDGESRYDSLLTFLRSRNNAENIPNGCTSLKKVNLQLLHTTARSIVASEEDSSGDEGGEILGEGGTPAPRQARRKNPDDIPNDIRSALAEIGRVSSGLALAIPIHPFKSLPGRSPWYGVRTDKGVTLT